MKTIVFAATKGGVGKSTLTTALAVAALKDRKCQVGMYDADPQGSLAFWWAARGGVDNPKLYTGIDDPQEIVDVLDGQIGVDYLLVDTGPGKLAAIEPWIEVADLIIVPVRTGAFDVMAIDPILETIATYDKPYLVVINEARRDMMLKTTRQLLQKEGHPVASTELAHRLAYQAAVSVGKSGPEVEKDGKCAEEIKGLWTEVKGILMPVQAKGARKRG